MKSVGGKFTAVNLSCECLLNFYFVVQLSLFVGGIKVVYLIRSRFVGIYVGDKAPTHASKAANMENNCQQF